MIINMLVIHEEKYYIIMKKYKCTSKEEKVDKAN